MKKKRTMVNLVERETSAFAEKGESASQFFPSLNVFSRAQDPQYVIDNLKKRKPKEKHVKIEYIQPVKLEKKYDEMNAKFERLSLKRENDELVDSDIFATLIPLSKAHQKSDFFRGLTKPQSSDPRFAQDSVNRLQQKLLEDTTSTEDSKRNNFLHKLIDQIEHEREAASVQKEINESHESSESSTSDNSMPLSKKPEQNTSQLSEVSFEGDEQNISGILQNRISLKDTRYEGNSQTFIPSYADLVSTNQISLVISQPNLLTSLDFSNNLITANNDKILNTITEEDKNQIEEKPKEPIRKPGRPPPIPKKESRKTKPKEAPLQKQEYIVAIKHKDLLAKRSTTKSNSLLVSKSTPKKKSKKSVHFDSDCSSTKSKSRSKKPNIKAKNKLSAKPTEPLVADLPLFKSSASSFIAQTDRFDRISFNSIEIINNLIETNDTVKDLTAGNDIIGVNIRTEIPEQILKPLSNVDNNTEHFISSSFVGLNEDDFGMNNKEEEILYDPFLMDINFGTPLPPLFDLIADLLTQKIQQKKDDDDLKSIEQPFVSEILGTSYFPFNSMTGICTFSTSQTKEPCVKIIKKKGKKAIKPRKRSSSEVPPSQTPKKTQTKKARGKTPTKNIPKIEATSKKGKKDIEKISKKTVKTPKPQRKASKSKKQKQKNSNISPTRVDIPSIPTKIVTNLDTFNIPNHFVDGFYNGNYKIDCTFLMDDKDRLPTNLIDTLQINLVEEVNSNFEERIDNTLEQVDLRDNFNINNKDIPIITTRDSLMNTFMNEIIPDYTIQYQLVNENTFSFETIYFVEDSHKQTGNEKSSMQYTEDDLLRCDFTSAQASFLCGSIRYSDSLLFAPKDGFRIINKDYCDQNYKNFEDFKDKTFSSPIIPECECRMEFAPTVDTMISNQIDVLFENVIAKSKASKSNKDSINSLLNGSPMKSSFGQMKSVSKEIDEIKEKTVDVMKPKLRIKFGERDHEFVDNSQIGNDNDISINQSIDNEISCNDYENVLQIGDCNIVIDTVSPHYQELLESQYIDITYNVTVNNNIVDTIGCQLSMESFNLAENAQAFDYINESLECCNFFETMDNQISDTFANEAQSYDTIDANIIISDQQLLCDQKFADTFCEMEQFDSYMYNPISSILIKKNNKDNDLFDVEFVSSECQMKSTSGKAVDMEIPEHRFIDLLLDDSSHSGAYESSEISMSCDSALDLLSTPRRRVHFTSGISSPRSPLFASISSDNFGRRTSMFDKEDISSLAISSDNLMSRERYSPKEWYAKVERMTQKTLLERMMFGIDYHCTTDLESHSNADLKQISTCEEPILEIPKNIICDSIENANDLAIQNYSQNNTVVGSTIDPGLLNGLEIDKKLFSILNYQSYIPNMQSKQYTETTTSNSFSKYKVPNRGIILNPMDYKPSIDSIIAPPIECRDTTPICQTDKVNPTQDIHSKDNQISKAIDSFEYIDHSINAFEAIDHTVNALESIHNTLDNIDSFNLAGSFNVVDSLNTIEAIDDLETMNSSEMAYSFNRLDTIFTDSIGSVSVIEEAHGISYVNELINDDICENKQKQERTQISYPSAPLSRISFMCNDSSFKAEGPNHNILQCQDSFAPVLRDISDQAIDNDLYGTATKDNSVKTSQHGYSLPFEAQDIIPNYGFGYQSRFDQSPESVDRELQTRFVSSTGKKAFESVQDNTLTKFEMKSGQMRFVDSLSIGERINNLNGDQILDNLSSSPQWSDITISNDISNYQDTFNQGNNYLSDQFYDTQQIDFLLTGRLEEECTDKFELRNGSSESITMLLGKKSDKNILSLPEFKSSVTALLSHTGFQKEEVSGICVQDNEAILEQKCLLTANDQLIRGETTMQSEHISLVDNFNSLQYFNSTVQEVGTEDNSNPHSGISILPSITGVTFKSKVGPYMSNMMEEVIMPPEMVSRTSHHVCNLMSYQLPSIDNQEICVDILNQEFNMKIPATTYQSSISPKICNVIEKDLSNNAIEPKNEKGLLSAMSSRNEMIDIASEESFSLGNTIFISKLGQSNKEEGTVIEKSVFKNSTGPNFVIKDTFTPQNIINEAHVICIDSYPIDYMSALTEEICIDSFHAELEDNFQLLGSKEITEYTNETSKQSDLILSNDINSITDVQLVDQFAGNLSGEIYDNFALISYPYFYSPQTDYEQAYKNINDNAFQEGPISTYIGDTSSLYNPIITLAPERQEGKEKPKIPEEILATDMCHFFIDTSSSYKLPGFNTTVEPPESTFLCSPSFSSSNGFKDYISDYSESRFNYQYRDYEISNSPYKNSEESRFNDSLFEIKSSQFNSIQQQTQNICSLPHCISLASPSVDKSHSSIDLGSSNIDTYFSFIDTAYPSFTLEFNSMLNPFEATSFQCSNSIFQCSSFRNADQSYLITGNSQFSIREPNECEAKAKDLSLVGSTDEISSVKYFGEFTIKDDEMMSFQDQFIVDSFDNTHELIPDTAFETIDYAPTDYNMICCDLMISSPVDEINPDLFTGGEESIDIELHSTLHLISDYSTLATRSPQSVLFGQSFNFSSFTPTRYLASQGQTEIDLDETESELMSEIDLSYFTFEFDRILSEVQYFNLDEKVDDNEIIHVDTLVPKCVDEIVPIDTPVPKCVDEIVPIDTPVPKCVDEIVPIDPLVPKCVDEIVLIDTLVPICVDKTASIDSLVQKCVDNVELYDHNILTYDINVIDSLIEPTQEEMSPDIKKEEVLHANSIERYLFAQNICQLQVSIEEIDYHPTSFTLVPIEKSTDTIGCIDSSANYIDEFILRAPYQVKYAFEQFYSTEDVLGGPINLLCHGQKRKESGFGIFDCSFVSQECSFVLKRSAKVVSEAPMLSDYYKEKLESKQTQFVSSNSIFLSKLIQERDSVYNCPMLCSIEDDFCTENQESFASSFSIIEPKIQTCVSFKSSEGIFVSSNQSLSIDLPRYQSDISDFSNDFGNKASSISAQSNLSFDLPEFVSKECNFMISSQPLTIESSNQTSEISAMISGTSTFVDTNPELFSLLLPKKIDRMTVHEESDVIEYRSEMELMQSKFSDTLDTFIRVDSVDVIFEKEEEDKRISLSSVGSCEFQESKSMAHSRSFFRNENGEIVEFDLFQLDFVSSSSPTISFAPPHTENGDFTPIFRLDFTSEGGEMKVSLINEGRFDIIEFTSNNSVNCQKKQELKVSLPIFTSTTAAKLINDTSEVIQTEIEEKHNWMNESLNCVWKDEAILGVDDHVINCRDYYIDTSDMPKQVTDYTTESLRCSCIDTLSLKDSNFRSELISEKEAKCALYQSNTSKSSKGELEYLLDLKFISSISDFRCTTEEVVQIEYQAFEEIKSIDEEALVECISNSSPAISTTSSTLSYPCNCIVNAHSCIVSRGDVTDNMKPVLLSDDFQTIQALISENACHDEESEKSGKNSFDLFKTIFTSSYSPFVDRILIESEKQEIDCITEPIDCVVEGTKFIDGIQIIDQSLSFTAEQCLPVVDTISSVDLGVDYAGEFDSTPENMSMQKDEVILTTDFRSSLGNFVSEMPNTIEELGNNEESDIIPSTKGIHFILQLPEYKSYEAMIVDKSPFASESINGQTKEIQAQMFDLFSVIFHSNSSHYSSGSFGDSSIGNIDYSCGSPSFVIRSCSTQKIPRPSFISSLCEFYSDSIDQKVRSSTERDEFPVIFLSEPSELSVLQSSFISSIPHQIYGEETMLRFDGECSYEGSFDEITSPMRKAELNYINFISSMCQFRSDINDCVLEEILCTDKLYPAKKRRVCKVPIHETEKVPEPIPEQKEEPPRRRRIRKSPASSVTKEAPQLELPPIEKKKAAPPLEPINFRSITRTAPELSSTPTHIKVAAPELAINASSKVVAAPKLELTPVLIQKEAPKLEVTPIPTQKAAPPMKVKMPPRVKPPPPLPVVKTPHFDPKVSPAEAKKKEPHISRRERMSILLDSPWSRISSVAAFEKDEFFLSNDVPDSAEPSSAHSRKPLLQPSSKNKSHATLAQPPVETPVIRKSANGGKLDKAVIDWRVFMRPKAFPISIDMEDSGHLLKIIRSETKEMNAQKTNAALLETARIFCSLDLTPLISVRLENSEVISGEFKRYNGKGSLDMAHVFISASGEIVAGNVRLSAKDRKVRLSKGILKVGDEKLIFEDNNFASVLEAVRRNDSSIVVKGFLKTIGRGDELAAITSPDLTVALSLLKAPSTPPDIVRELYEVFYHEKMRDYLIRTLILSELSTVRSKEAFTKPNPLCRVLASLCRPWLASLSEELEKAKTTTDVASAMIKLIPKMPPHAMYVVRSTVVLALLVTVDRNESIAMLYASLICAAELSGFSVNPQIRSGRGPEIASLSLIVVKILEGEFPTETKPTKASAERVLSYITENHGEMAGAMKSAVDKNPSQHPLVASFYQNFRFILNSKFNLHVPNMTFSL